MPYLGKEESPAMAIIHLLQRRGSATVKEIEAELGVTTTAVRLQLSALQAEGLVAARTVRKGVGRPHYEYFLTEKASYLFVHYCDELALLLYEALLEDQGPEKVRKLLGRVRDRLAAQYGDQIQGTELRHRVEQLAAWLDSRGILTEVEPQDDKFVLREYNCPYPGLARQYREICEMEQQMIAQLLNADVSLERCMMDGNVGCQFTVSHQEPAAE
ncbi:MAG TPA: ArsR family transcriptional regulator [Caldilineae bacterium]|jgi:predicted ArsR family transcriptional regulator|nr:ArsR family transcriptional regulator [Caldilineae bacterium]